MIDQKKFPGKFGKYATSQVFVHNKVRYNNLFIGAWFFQACTVTQQTLVQVHIKLWYRMCTRRGFWPITTIVFYGLGECERGQFSVTKISQNGVFLK